MTKLYVFTDVEGIEYLTKGALYEFIQGPNGTTGGTILNNRGKECYVLTEHSGMTCAHLKERGSWKFAIGKVTLENE